MNTTVLETLRDRLREQKSNLAPIALLCLAAFLLFFPFGANKKATAAQTTKTETDALEYEQQLQQRLEALLEQVEGIGKVSVMITLASGEEGVYATDEEVGANTFKTEHVLLSDGTPLRETVRYPQVCGVAVVCQGAKDAKVRSAVVEAVSALFELSTNHISVIQMQE